MERASIVVEAVSLIGSRARLRALADRCSQFKEAFMAVANLTRYTIDYVPDSCDGDYVQHNVSKDGEYVKFEEAVEASSNSLQQLKAEILPLLEEAKKDLPRVGMLYSEQCINQAMAKLSAV